MKSPKQQYRFRKCSDVNREHALFELLDGEIILFDIGLSDSGVLEIAFHEGIENRIIELPELLHLFEEGRQLASSD